MYLVQPRPWVSEYKLGAACRMQSDNVPDALHGLSIGSMTMILYDCGLVLVAVKPKHHHWKLAESETTFQRSMKGMFITYHEVQSPLSPTPSPVYEAPHLVSSSFQASCPYLTCSPCIVGQNNLNSSALGGVAEKCTPVCSSRSEGGARGGGVE